MTFLILMLAVSLVMASTTVRRMRHDGQGPTRPPASHFEDPRFGPAGR